MSHPLLDIESIDQKPDAYLSAVGAVFAVFDERTQDSGNIAYGVRIGPERYFVKTAGSPGDPLRRAVYKRSRPHVRFVAFHGPRRI